MLSFVLEEVLSSFLEMIINILKNAFEFIAYITNLSINLLLQPFINSDHLFTIHFIYTFIYYIVLSLLLILNHEIL
jgi:hypothetical protein